MTALAHKRYIAIAALLCLAQPQQALSEAALPWQSGGPPSSSQTKDTSLHSVSGVPLFIDGTQTKKIPPKLTPGLLDQVKSVATLGDALRILGPAYIAPDDSLHIAHWHFQNGAMLTLWPQGGETLADPVFVSPRPDCGVPAAQCTDLVLNRKQAPAQHKHSSGGNGSSGSSTSLMSPLMKMFPGR